MNENKIEKSGPFLKKCIIYIRVSSDKQTGDDHHSLQMQEDMCKNYAKLYSYGIKDIFIDAGLSGTNMNRPNLFKALEKMDETDSLMVYSISRLSRNMRDFSNIIYDLTKKKQFLISVSEHFDSSTPSGSLIMNLLACFSEFEASQISKRTSDTMRNQKEKGLHMGKIPFGWRKTDIKGVFEEDKNEQNIIKKIFDLFDEGLKIRKIQLTINDMGFVRRNNKPFDYKTISNILKNYETNKLKMEMNNKAR